MKKSLLIACLCISGIVSAQENWQNIEANGFAYGATFHFTEVFQNKIYVAADTGMTGILLYSSPSGNPGSYTEETGLGPVLQGVNETALASSVSNSNYLFFGSATYYDTLAGYVTPQVYRFDGVNYVKHGTINHALLPANSGFDLSIKKMVLYSPSGSNDTVYAFVNNGGLNPVSLWKAPIAVSNPTWINQTLSFPTGVTNVYDAKVWHKQLYVAVNSPGNGGLILRTSNGATWDTVVSAYGLQNTLGGNYYLSYFEALEIYKDTLVAGLNNNLQALWYTADSAAPIQIWKTLIDSASYGNITNSWYNVSDMKIGDGKLWVQVNYSNQNPAAFICMKNAGNKDTLLRSSGSTGLESSFNAPNAYKMSYFNNAIYATGFTAPPQRVSNPDQRSISINGTLSFGNNTGNIWRFTTINPTANFKDSVPAIAGAGYCVNNKIYLVNQTANGLSYLWYLNGALYSHAQDTFYISTVAGTDAVKLVAYNGTYQSLYTDSITKTITINSLPVLDSLKASLYTVCQGQADTLKAFVSGGASPFLYMWQYGVNIFGPDSIIVEQLTIVSSPSPTPVGMTVQDANNCFSNATTMYIYVNAGDSLSGVISDASLNPVTAGEVYLFQKKMNHVGLADSAGKVNINANGTYYFPGLYYGDYYLKAIADTNVLMYKNSVGTYYSNKQNAYQWDSAVVIQQHTCAGGNNSGKNVAILQIPVVPSGPGEITGIVTEGPGFGQRYVNGGYSPMGAPLKGVDVKLGKNPGGNAAARTTTDGSGNYSFHNVPLGNYKIYVDIPNYGMDSVRAVVLTTTDTLSVHNDYFVDSSMVRVVPTYTATTAICQGDSILLQNVYQHNAGVYYDTLTATAGYDSLIMTNLSITPLPTVTVTANTFTVCSGSPVTLTAGGTNSYQWSTNAGSVTTSTASVNPTANTTYTITGITNGCSDKKTVSINVKPLPGVTANASLDTVCAGGSVTLVGGGATTYTWSNGVTNWVPFNPATTNTYTVIGTGANACVNTATVTVVVKSCIGIRQISAAGLLNVYPNPAMNSLFIEVEKSAKIKIYDITGQLVMEQSINIGKNEINISSLPSGAYDLMLNANGQITYVKLMVNK